MPDWLAGGLFAIGAGFLAWVAGSLVKVTVLVAQHAEKHEQHERRFERLEDRIA